MSGARERCGGGATSCGGAACLSLPSPTSATHRAGLTSVGVVGGGRRRVGADLLSCGAGGGGWGARAVKGRGRQSRPSDWARAVSGGTASRQHATRPPTRPSTRLALATQCCCPHPHSPPVCHEISTELSVHSCSSGVGWGGGGGGGGRRHGWRQPPSARGAPPRARHQPNPSPAHGDVHALGLEASDLASLRAAGGAEGEVGNHPWLAGSIITTTPRPKPPPRATLDARTPPPASQRPPGRRVWRNRVG